MSGAWAVHPTGEPFDFRHQAADYARYRRDYSTALYEAIEAAAGPGAGRTAVDVGTGTGFVASSLAGRGWRAIGVDFSAPMLACAPPGLARVRATGEALPLRAGTAALVACGTAFHWMAPRAALAELARVLRPGGWAALFWRYPRADEPSVRVVEAALDRVGCPLPPLVRVVHAPEPFADERALEPMPARILPARLQYDRDAWVGLVSTIETYRRVTGPAYGEFLSTLRELAARDLPSRVVEHADEHLFLARRR